MKDPILVVMAAGLGSRYGGLKQMDTVGNNGEWMIDYSLFDAYRAGFRRVVFIVREDIRADFEETIGRRVSEKLDVAYAIQRMDDLPFGMTIPKGRQKPWGTAHAIYSARKEIDGASFVAINADDYYGIESFQKLYVHLMETGEKDPYNYAMAGYLLKNTVTDNGHVARGVCRVDESGRLLEITERTQIKKWNDEIKYTEDEGESWTNLPLDTPVSLNCWGFHATILDEMEKGFEEFSKRVDENPLKAEYFLPSVVERMIKIKKATVDVLKTADSWYGVTYREDKLPVSSALDQMKEEGQYPADLWA